MGTKNQTSTGTSSGTATTTLSPQVQAAYNTLLTQLGGVSSGTNGATTGATSGLGALAASPNANFSNAGATLNSATTPASASISQYLTPYLSGALQTQIANQNQQDLQQQQAVTGNAAAQGALGGNRVGVAQGQLAGQQAIANNAANSSLVNSAYQQAENAALQGQSNLTSAGTAQTNLGNAANASTLSDLLGQLSAGNSQFSNLATLGSLASGLSNSGQTISTTGTTSQTQPAGNWLSSLVGAGLGIAGLFNKGGVVGHYDAGGSIGNSSALMAALDSTMAASRPQANDNQANDNSPFGNLASPAQMKAGVSNIRGWLSPSTSMPLGLGETGGFGSSYRGGGAVRGYDDGGYVDPPPAYMTDLLNQITDAPDTGPASYGVSDAPQPMLPESGYSGLNSQIASPPASVVPALIGNSGLTMPSSDTQAIDGLASQGLPAMLRAVQSQPGVRADPSFQALPPGVTPQSRMVARDQQMASQGFPVTGLGALAAADEQAYNLPPGYLSRTAQIESSGNPNASNPSGATGLFQFMPSTARQYGLTNPDDPVASTNAAAKLAADNASVLTNGLGRAPTAGELYLAHQQGAGGALGLLRNPSAPAASIIGAGAVIQNGGTPDMTAGQFASMWENKFGAGDNGARGLVPNPTSPTGAPAGGIPGGLGVTPPGGYGVPDSNAGYATTLPQVLQSLQAGKGLNLSPDARMGLLSAAAGMMSGTSPFAFANIGTGVQQGVKTWQDQQALERENALANSAIGAQQGELGISGQQLQLTAQQTAAQVAQEIASANRENVAAANEGTTITPAGIGAIVKTVDPATGQVTYGRLPYSSIPVIGQSGSAPAPAAPARSGVSPTGVDANGFTLTAPDMSTRLPMLANTDAGAAQLQAQGHLLTDPAIQQAVNSRAADVSLAQMSDLAGSLPTSGLLTQGAGFNSRVGIVNAANTVLSSLGIKPVDPASVATAEDLKKLATQLQFAVADQVKADPAASTIVQAAGASPSGENTLQGFKRIIGNLQAVNKRSEDRAAFLQSWQNQNMGIMSTADGTTADDVFNRLNPPSKYIDYGQKLATAIVPKTQADINNAPKGTVFNIDGTLMVK